MKPPLTFETQRLFLKKPVTEDAALIFKQYAQDPEVTKYVSWQPHQSIEETRKFIQQSISEWTNSSAFPYVLICKENAQLVGMVAIRINNFKADLGYVLAKSEWGKGYMSEAVQVLIDWALKQDEIYRIWAVCDIENPASARVMEKVGMQREGILKRWIILPNISKEPRDCYCYAVSK